MKIKKRKKYISLLFVLLLGLSVGFALLQANLKINGSSKIQGSSWDIHFENLNVTEGSVSIGTGDVAAAIQSSTTDITYTVTLNLPGDYYEFTVDAVNAGSVDGMIESVTSKLNNEPITTLPAYLNYSVTYSDGVALSPNQYLKAGDSETYKVRVEFKRDIESTDLPTTAQTLTFNFGVVYIQADSNAITRTRPFADEDWDIIIQTIKSTNSCGPYHVGDSKEVNMGSLGTHTLRISNCSRPTECSNDGFSQTACGVVLEFTDSIALLAMNSSNSSAGGWPSSEIRTYANNTIYNALPVALKNAIIDTTVVSGHSEQNGATNFTTIDKLYLPATHEVFEDIDGNTSSGQDYYDTAYYNTRQFDYYKELEVASTFPDDRINEGSKKMNGGTLTWWWLRSALYYDNYFFFCVHTSGALISYNARSDTGGISPAFRIA